MTRWMARLPGSQIYFPTMGIGAGSVFYGVLVYAIQSPERKTLIRTWLFPYRKGILCALLAGILFFAGWRWSRPSEVMVAFIDVGQGDAMMVKTVHGHAMMFEKRFSFLMQKYGAETAWNIGLAASEHMKFLNFPHQK